MNPQADDERDFLAWSERGDEIFPASRLDEALLSDVLSRTDGPLRKRRNLRTGLRYGAVALLLLAAFGVGRWSVSEPPARPTMTPSIDELEVVATAVEGPLAADAPEPNLRGRALARFVESKAFDEDTAQSWRAAGDAWLAAPLGQEEALRCYRRHLDRLPSNARSWQPTDSWLLASLKIIP